MGEELTGIAGALVHGVFARHFHVAAQRNRADAVIGLALAETAQACAKANGKHFYADSEELGRSVMAELVDQDHEPEYDCHGENGDQEMGHKRSSYSLCDVMEATREIEELRRLKRFTCSPAAWRASASTLS